MYICAQFNPKKTTLRTAQKSAQLRKIVPKFRHFAQCATSKWLDMTKSDSCSKISLQIEEEGFWCIFNKLCGINWIWTDEIIIELLLRYGTSSIFSNEFNYETPSQFDMYCSNNNCTHHFGKIYVTDYSQVVPYSWKCAHH